jgi:hypothetical protein
VRYVHPDHLNSTNVVTDQNQNLVQTLDFYPYGATRVSVSTSTNEKRKFIGQFLDDSNLEYLNARYYNPPLELRRRTFPTRTQVIASLAVQLSVMFAGQMRWGPDAGGLG